MMTFVSVPFVNVRLPDFVLVEMEKHSMLIDETQIDQLHYFRFSSDFIKYTYNMRTYFVFTILKFAYKILSYKMNCPVFKGLVR